MQTSNPALGRSAFDRLTDAVRSDGRAMTVAGAAAKAFVLLLLVTAAAGWTWLQALQRTPDVIMGAAGVAALAGFVIAMVTIFMPRVAPVTAPLYAVLEGVVLGGISQALNARYHGLPMLAVVITLGIAAAAFTVYAFRIVRVTDGLRRGVVVVMLGLLAIYLLQWVLGMFGVAAMAALNQGPLAIGLSVVAIGAAAVCLLIDFDQIEQMAAQRLPAKAEWYAAFSLLMTIVWLYLEVLRLLSRLQKK